MIKIATFDIDGTLMSRHPDSYTLKIEAFDIAVRQTFGIANFNYIDYLKPSMFGMTDRSIMRMLMLDLGIKKDELDKKFDLLFENIFTFFLSHPEHTTDKDYYLLDGAKNILETLKQKGIELGLATGNYEHFARWKVDGLGIGDYFTFGGFGNDADDRAEIVGIAISRASTNNSRIIHFGDTPVDIEAAHENKIFAGAITTAGGATFDRKVLEQTGADLLIDSWENTDMILDFLENHSE